MYSIGTVFVNSNKTNFGNSFLLNSLLTSETMIILQFFFTLTVGHRNLGIELFIKLCLTTLSQA